nr:reverse transcriptase domain-containing protein [Tanacetum cinerariifolium]
MCDASDFAIGAILGQRHEKHFRPIHYASKMMNDAETSSSREEYSVRFLRRLYPSFLNIEEKLTEAPILIAPNWDLPFELMCDASDFAIGAILGQRHEKHFRPIHYASKMMNDAETNYTTTEKEMLAVVYAFEKFRSYLIMNKSIVHTDHSALKYLFSKKDAKARLLGGFCCSKNLISSAPWFADFANYHAGNFIINEMSIYDFMTLPSWGDAKVVEEPHHLSLPLLERVPSHTTAPAAEGAIIPLPTPDEIVASIPDPRLAKNSKAGSSASKLGQVEGVNDTDLTNFCAEIGSSLERDEGNSSRASSTPTTHLGKRLGAPPSMADVSASRPAHGGTLVYASTFGRGCATSYGLLDSLAGRALARDVEYDQILEDDFGIATHGEEIDLTLFPLTPGPYQMSYPYEGASSPSYTKEECNGRHEPEANRFNVLSAMLVSHVVKLNSCHIGLVSATNPLLEKFDQKAGYVKVLCSEVTDLDGKLERMQKDHDAFNQLTLEKATSQGYKDAIDGLREKVTQFIGSGEGITHGRIDVEFEAAVQKVSNFHVSAKADFNKALVDFPTTPFPFLNKIYMASGGTLFEVTQVLPKKHIRSIIPTSAVQSIVNEDVDQVLLEHASNASTASI